MHSPKLSFRISPDLHKELLRQAKAKKKSVSEVARLLIDNQLQIATNDVAIAENGEDSSENQALLMMAKLGELESRWLAQLERIERATAAGLFYSEQTALVNTQNPSERNALRQAADEFVRHFRTACK